MSEALIQTSGVPPLVMSLNVAPPNRWASSQRGNPVVSLMPPLKPFARLRKLKSVCSASSPLASRKRCLKSAIAARFFRP